MFASFCLSELLLEYTIEVCLSELGKKANGALFVKNSKAVSFLIFAWVIKVV